MKTIILFIVLFGGTLFPQDAQRLSDIRTIKIGCKVNPNQNEEKVFQKNINYTVGFDLELIKIITDEFKKRNINVEYITLDAKDREDYLQKNIVDLVISNLSITPNRIKEIDFSNPYLTNPGLAFLAKNDSEYRFVNDVLNGNPKISVVKETNSNTELEEYKKSHNSNFEIFDNYIKGEDAIAALKHNEVDVHLDDYYNLLYYDISDPALEIIGLFPMENFEDADHYAIGMKKGRQYLLEFVNKTLKEHGSEINELQKKWFDIPNKNILFRLRNISSLPSATEKFLAKWGLWIVLFILIATTGIIFLIIRSSKKHTHRLEIKFGETEKNLRDQINSIKEQFRLSALGKEEIVSNGIKFFSTCDDIIYYVGAGGFMADIHGDDWREAISNFVRHRKKRMIRIVDLPPVEEVKTSFNEEDKINYFKWLVIQAVELNQNPGLVELYNSRGAPLWGHGFIIMIKDSSEMMLFTGGVVKYGYLIQIEQLVDNFKKSVEDLRYHGMQLGCDDIISIYFKNSQVMEEALRIAKESQDRDAMIKITEFCRKYVKSLNQ